MFIMNSQIMTCDDLSTYPNSQQDAEIINSLAAFLIKESELDEKDIKVYDESITQADYDKKLCYDNNLLTDLVSERIIPVKKNLSDTEIGSPLDDEKIYTPLESVRFDQIHNEAEQQSDNISRDDEYDEMVFKDEIIEKPSISNFNTEYFTQNISEQVLWKQGQNESVDTNENDDQMNAISNNTLDKNPTTDHSLDKNNLETHDEKNEKSCSETLNRIVLTNDDGEKQKRKRKKSNKLFNYPYYITKKKNYCELQKSHNYNLRAKIKRRRKLAGNLTVSRATKRKLEIKKAVKDHLNDKENTRIEKDINASEPEFISTKTNNNNTDTTESSIKECDKYFTRPSTPNKHKNGKISNKNFQKNRNDSIVENLTDEDKILLNCNTNDTPTSSDNEFDQICNFIKNNNCHREQYSFDSIELLNEFEDIDQSTNDKLLADLLNSPRRSRNSQCDNDTIRNGTSTPLPSLSDDRLKENSNCIDPLSIRSDNCNNQISEINDNALDSVQENNSSTAILEKEIQIPLRRIQYGYDSSNKRKIVADNDSDSITESNGDDEELDESLKERIKKAKTSFKISDELLEKLDDLSIKFQHDVPRQHQIENGVCKPPTENIIKLFEKYASLKSGNYSPEEDRIIKANWESFCQNHDWDEKIVEPFLNFHYGGRTVISYNKAIQFVQFLCKNLPNRTLHSVLMRFRTLYSKKKPKKFLGRKDYSIEEDKIILKYLGDKSAEKYNQKVKILSRILNRSVNSLYIRCKKLRDPKNVCRPLHRKKRRVRKTITWNVKLTEKFLENLIKLTLCQATQELFDQKIPTVVWIELESIMKISWNELRNYWTTKLHMQLFSKNPIFVNDLKVMLIELMYSKKINKMEDLNWKEFSQYFESATPEYLKALFYNIVGKHYKPSDENLHHCIKWLYRKKMPFLKTTLNERYLPRLSYENGKIKIIDKSMSHVLFKKNNQNSLGSECNERHSTSDISDSEDDENMNDLDISSSSGGDLSNTESDHDNH